MFRFTSQFDKLLEKATSNLLMEADLATILQIGDLIRQNDVQPKYALAAVKKKIASPNPHTAMFAVQLLESMVKNCGPALHDELTTTTYCASLQELVRGTTHDNVQQKLLELIQVWTFAFRKNPKYSTLKDTVNALKSEGYKFPAMRESDAMFTAHSAPSWCDGEVCHRCRTQFNLVLRKHHCRACGQVFCKACTTKSSTLPKFGIEKEVRVCDACFDQVNKPASSTSAAKDADMEEYLKSSLAQQSQVPPRKSEEEIREEEELQLALALSQSEAEHKEKEKMRVTSAYFTFKDPLPALKDLETIKRSPSPPEDNSNPELARYLNRSYWENRQTDSIEQGSIASPSAPAKEPSIASSGETKLRENGIVVDQELEEFVKTLKSQVEIFINRMKSNSSRGRSIANDSSVQTLFMNITAMHSKLLRYIQQHDDSRLLYERLQDKLAQVKDARAALDALRDEHREKLRRQAEEAERQRQLLMAHKLDIMRKKKQEYLQYQRQVALQRIQEQEREMQMRQEQQKQQYIMGSLCFMGSPVHGQQFPSNVAPPSGNYGYQYGMPGMVGHPQGTLGQMGHPQNSMQGPPVYPPGYMPNQNMPPPQGHPLNMQQPPQGLPTNMQPPSQTLPPNMQPPPQNMQVPPQNMQQPPQGLPPNMTPQNMQQSLPPNMQAPQSMQTPQNMQPPPQNLPSNMNVQNMMPQNGPQNQAMMQQPGIGYGQQQQQQQQETSPKQMVQPKEEAQIAELIKFD